MDCIGDETLFFRCDEEESNAKTKGYSATLLLLMLIGIYLGEENHFLNKEMANNILAEIKTAVYNLDELMNIGKEWCKKTQYGKEMNHLYVIGNGMNYATAMEGALKLMETQCIPTMFSDIEEFSHGMHRSLKQDSYVILINSEVDKDLMSKTFHYLKDKGINVMMINTNKSIDDECVVNIKNEKYTQSILSITLLIQIMAVFVPELNGVDPNREANNDYTDCMQTRV